jgi:uncharacterized membrane protein YccC
MDEVLRRVNALARSLPRAVFRPDARRIDEVECAVSVLLAIGLAHAIGASNISWAAFSGYMVMRGHVLDSLLRGILRIVGTTAGAGIALLIVPRIGSSLVLCVLACATVGGISLYAALTERRAYAWLFVGLTFEMVLLDKLETPTDAISGFASTRILEVVAGTTACVIVSALSALTLRRRWPSPRAPAARRIGWHPQAARHAGQAAVALAFLPLLWSLFAIPALAQSAVSIMAVMLVPLTSIGVSGLMPVSRKLFYRVAGCLAGSALAVVFLLVSHGSATLLVLGSVLGVLIGRHIENGGNAVSYVGTQFVLAVLVTLVPDSYAHAAIEPAFDRLIGILIGMALLEPVLIGWHLIAPPVRQGSSGVGST